MKLFSPISTLSNSLNPINLNSLTFSKLPPPISNLFNPRYTLISTLHTYPSHSPFPITISLEPRLTRPPLQYFNKLYVSLLFNIHSINTITNTITNTNGTKPTTNHFFFPLNHSSRLITRSRNTLIFIPEGSERSLKGTSITQPQHNQPLSTRVLPYSKLHPPHSIASNSGKSTPHTLHIHPLFNKDEHSILVTPRNTLSPRTILLSLGQSIHQPTLHPTLSITL